MAATKKRGKTRPIRIKLPPKNREAAGSVMDGRLDGLYLGYEWKPSKHSKQRSKSNG